MEIPQLLEFGEFSKDKFVEFALRSEHLDPQKASSELAIAPSHAFAKGDKRIHATVDPDTGETSERTSEKPWGLWALNSKGVGVTEKLEKHVLFLLEQLEPKQDKIAQYLRRGNDYDVFFYIWWMPDDGDGGYLIGTEVPQRMSRLCHYVEFSFGT